MDFKHPHVTSRRAGSGVVRFACFSSVTVRVPFHRAVRRHRSGGARTALPSFSPVFTRRCLLGEGVRERHRAWTEGRHLGGHLRGWAADAEGCCPAAVDPPGRLVPHGVWGPAAGPPGFTFRPAATTEIWNGRSTPGARRPGNASAAVSLSRPGLATAPACRKRLAGLTVRGILRASGRGAAQGSGVCGLTSS
uniref:Uncharacterized protein n=1 Tax=Streptomyces griseus TaxID=1911 RepID=A0A513TZM8_STRGR|nr:hypothetical protein [Streptomyces griseus]